MLFPAVGIGVYERNRVDRARDVGGRGEGDGGKIWSVGKTGGGVLGRFGQIHGVGLISVRIDPSSKSIHFVANAWAELYVQSVSEIFKEKDRMRIEGFISTQGAPSKVSAATCYAPDSFPYSSVSVFPGLRVSLCV
jgi:hypothetical protein